MDAMRGLMTLRRRACTVGALLIAGAACQLPHQEFITREQLGGQWPFTVPSGTLYCEKQGNHIVFESGGTQYAINGSAKGAAAANGYVAVDPILRQLPPEPVKVRVDRLPEPRRKDVFTEAARCDGASAFGNVECRANILENVGITDVELRQILEEGIAMAWPPMPPRRVDMQPIITRGLALCGQ
jgi:hypothetical protein